MVPITTPYEVFFDLDGKPLDNGYIFIGQPNQNPEISPITVYWDIDGNTPASQPLRTTDGYIYRNGSPAVVYINQEYSITVRDKKRQLVYSEPSSLDFDPLVGINSFITYPSQNILGYGRNWFDIQVPAVTDFIDNVFSVQNKSTNGTHYGNAAIAFLDRAGTERGAMGYSRNSAIQPDGYYPDLVYIEIGNPFTTDSQNSDFAVVVTFNNNPTFPFTSLKAIEVDSTTANIFFRTRGSGNVFCVGNFITQGGGIAAGGIADAQQISAGMTNTSARYREYGAGNSFAWTTNVSNLDPAAIAQDDATKSSWKVAVGYGTGSLPYESYKVSYAAPGATTWKDLLTVNKNGTYISQATPSTGWNFSVDDSLPVSVNNGATYNLAPSSGMVMINDYNGGASALFLASAGNVLLVAQTGAQFVAGAPGAGQVGLEFSGGVYRINNNKGSNTTFGVMMFASRQTA